MIGKVRRYAAVAIVLGAGTVLAACGGPVPANPRLAPAGSSPSFVDGYVIGCDAGAADANPTGYVASTARDPKRYLSDNDYKKGWDQGHAACYEDELRAPTMGRTNGGGGGNI